MKTKLSILFILGAVFLAGTAQADQVGFLAKKEVAIGKPAGDFTLQDLSGNTHKLSDYQGQVVMLHFWSAQCPFVLRYEDRLQAVTSEYSDQGVQVLAIDSNKTEDLKMIQDVAAERNVNYPILLDPGNKVADQFGAVTTPHVYLIDQNGVLVSEGAVDDQGWSAENEPGTHYLKENLDAVLSGNPVPYPETQSVGCTIKREI